MPLTLGEPAPWFRAPTASKAEFTFDTVAGRYVLMAFLPMEAEARGAALKALSAHQGLFDDRKISAFVVVRDEETAAGVRDLFGLRWFLDFDGAISRAYGALDAEGAARPLWMLLDPTLRVVGSAPIDRADLVFRTLAGLGAAEDHAGVPMHAPVLIAPRIFEPELCRALIDGHAEAERRFTGVMRDAGDRTVAVMDELKRRRDWLIEDEALQAAIRERLQRRLYPMIERALGFRATEIERYLVSCYDAADGGVFHPHRDNTTMGTAHRKFAASINLNDDFEGGDLRFPEYGARTYRPPVGGACVFSCALLHEATPMTAGRRYAFLPFLYDAAGAAVQKAYWDRVGEPA